MSFLKLDNINWKDNTIFINNKKHYFERHVIFKNECKHLFLNIWTPEMITSLTFLLPIKIKCTRLDNLICF